MQTERRHDLDWLRVIAFVVLIYFHAAIIFVPGGLPLIQNEETSPFLQVFVNISAQFRLGLLFLISGIGVAFARRHRTKGEFFKERCQRLLLPLGFGILVVVPPMVYLEKVFIGAFMGDLWSFYGQLFTRGLYPAGNLSWHHFWFIAYLFLFCILGLLFYKHLNGSNRPESQRIDNYSKGYGIYLLILPLTLIELTLRPTFPGFRDLIHDWASFSHWFVLFLAGFTLAHHTAVIDRAIALRWLSLCLAIFSTLMGYAVFGRLDFTVPMNDPGLVPKFIFYALLISTMVWSSLLACLGFAGRYLNFENRAIRYLNEAVYPLFILHLTVSTAFGFVIADTDLGIAPKYLMITTGTLITVLLSYHFFIRPFNFMRLLFGVKPRASSKVQLEPPETRAPLA